MTRAFASWTSARTSRSVDIRLTRNPSLAPPSVYQPIKKEVGTKKLVLGKWVIVNEDDADAFVKAP